MRHIPVCLRSPAFDQGEKLSRNVADAVGGQDVVVGLGVEVEKVIKLF